MKKFFSLYLVLGVGLVAFAVFFFNRQSETNKKELERELAAVKQKFAEAHASVRNIADPNDYLRAQNQMLRKYRDEIEKLAKRDKDLLDVDAEKKKFAEADEKGKPNEEQKRLREEYFELTKAAYEKLMGGDYKPELTMANNGARFDVVSLRRVSSPAGGDMLRADFIAWGFPPDVNYGDINMAVWAARDPAELKKKPAKAGEKIEEIKYKFDANQARPIIAISNPQRWVPAFPPTVTVGYYYLQALPRDSQKLDLTFHYRINTPDGRTVPVDLAFMQMPVTEMWMLPPGAKFQAIEKEASDNERLGKPEEEDAPAAKTAKRK